MKWFGKLIMGFLILSGVYYLLKYIQNGHGLEVFTILVIVSGVIIFGGMFLYIKNDGNHTN